MASHTRGGCGDSSGRGGPRRGGAGHLPGGHRGRGGRPRGAPPPLRALCAARGTRGPRRRAPPGRRAAGGERPQVAGHEPPRGGLHPQGAVQRGVHGVRSGAASARGPGAARAHARQGGRDTERGRQGAVAEPGAADRPGHVVLRAAGHRTRCGRLTRWW
ncbi:unnamed protein product [Leptidea sinapis]|uniref:Uncharacterized protein n=1 Tax=Leptidea sinapis TaxID=189913 RepID=A0A5E4QF72_9NEOP|nr:unnamed protein product [Leptidea sinapis]